MSIRRADRRTVLDVSASAKGLASRLGPRIRKQPHGPLPGFGLIMAVGTRGVLADGLTTLPEPEALALAFVVGLQIAVVEATALHGLFTTTDLDAGAWLLAIVVASSILILEESRTLVIGILRSWPSQVRAGGSAPAADTRSPDR